MKKLVCLVMALSLTIGLMGLLNMPYNVHAEGYDVPCTKEENLATNKNNWLTHTVSNANSEITENGIRMDGHTKDQSSSIYFRGNNMGEFKFSMLVNAHLNVPGEGKAMWRFSEIYISFLVNRNPEDAVGEDSVPWYAHNVYGTFCFGLTSGGVPISRFMYYNAFAKNCGMGAQFYQPYGGYTDTNVVDGKDHWIEVEVKNYDNEGKRGKKWLGYIDGVKVAEFDRDDDLYYDSASQQEYQVDYSKLSGGIGIYTNTDWPAGYSPSKMDNYIDIKKVKMLCYDEDPLGKVVGQCAAPVFNLTAKEYPVAATYDVGDPIEVQLTDLFDYQGEDPVEYKITCNGENIGEIVNGFWTWTPSEGGSYDIDFNAKVTEENKAVNYLTFRVKDAPLPPAPDSESKPSTEKDPPKKGGCGGSVHGSVLCLSLLLGSLVIFKRKIK